MSLAKINKDTGLLDINSREANLDKLCIINKLCKSVMSYGFKLIDDYDVLKKVTDLLYERSNIRILDKILTAFEFNDFYITVFKRHNEILLISKNTYMYIPLISIKNIESTLEYFLDKCPEEPIFIEHKRNEQLKSLIL